MLRHRLRIGVISHARPVGFRAARVVDFVRHHVCWLCLLEGVRWVFAYLLLRQNVGGRSVPYSTLVSALLR